MRIILKAAITAAAFSIFSSPNSAMAAKAASPTPLFAHDEMLHLTLRAPTDRMSRALDAKPVPGVLTVVGAQSETLPVELSVRGITRRRIDICPFPALRVQFTKKPAATSIFKGQNGLKLVTHCRPAENYQQHTLLEYTAYRLYNALTPESFDVRLATIDYVAEDGHAITTRVGFFVEDIDDVADRNEQKRLRNVNHVLVRQIEPAAAARDALFEYMIGNLDWAMQASPTGADCCHNGRLVGTKGKTTELVPVPYDFDFSGLVDAPYAAPPPSIKVSSVRVRRYRGFCQHNEQAQAVAADMFARRASVLAVLDQTPQLDQSSKQRAANYLNEFFDSIASPQKVDAILKNCIQVRSLNNDNR